MPNLSAIIMPNKQISYANLKTEQKMCIEFANEMRALTLEGKLPYVWFHISNEFLPSTRVNYSFEIKQKHLGKISGVPDYCFLGAHESFFIEFKSPKGKQTDSQKIFHNWCISKNVGYWLAYSAKEGIEIIKNKLNKG